MRSACAGEPFYKEHEGKYYCMLHFPGKEKSAGFKEAFQRKFENNDFDFGGVWFPDELFFKLDFGGPVFFRSATFSAQVDFRVALSELLRTFQRKNAGFSFF